jgi:hypothetical protein
VMIFCQGCCLSLGPGIFKDVRLINCCINQVMQTKKFLK